VHLKFHLNRRDFLINLFLKKNRYILGLADTRKREILQGSLDKDLEASCTSGVPENIVGRGLSGENTDIVVSLMQVAV